MYRALPYMACSSVSVAVLSGVGLKHQGLANLIYDCPGEMIKIGNISKSSGEVYP